MSHTITVVDICPTCGKTENIELDKEEADAFGVLDGDTWHHICHKCHIIIDLRTREALPGPRTWNRKTKESCFLLYLCEDWSTVQQEAIALCKKMVNL